MGLWDIGAHHYLFSTSLGSKRVSPLYPLNLQNKLVDLVCEHFKNQECPAFYLCYLREHFTLLFLHISIKKINSLSGVY